MWHEPMSKKPELTNFYIWSKLLPLPLIEQKYWIETDRPTEDVDGF